VNLLDTHAIVWGLSDPDRLSAAARRIVAEGNFVVSCVSLLDLINKKRRSTALLSDPLPWWRTYVEKSGIPVLSIDPDHIAHLDVLPGPVRDPVDRILMAQCIVNGLRLVTVDRQIRDNYQDHLHIIW
jgi:PIN domain nuclease of toxin-antitoxin system